METDAIKGTVMHSKINDYVISCFLAAILGTLGWMSNSLYEISQSLAVVLYHVADHDDRISSLENWRLTVAASKRNR